jgi:hypothetical protein
MIVTPRETIDHRRARLAGLVLCVVAAVLSSALSRAPVPASGGLHAIAAVVAGRTEGRFARDDVDRSHVERGHAATSRSADRGIPPPRTLPPPPSFALAVADVALSPEMPTSAVGEEIATRPTSLPRGPVPRGPPTV